MGVDILLGLQWGDEGKGKIVDVIAPQYQVVARFQGGPNAGHTLVIDGLKHVLHQIPSGIFHSEIWNVIGNGVVIDPVIFRKEIEGLEAKGVDVRSKLLLSNRTHLILPTHRMLDAANETKKGDAKIGSTLKGIGPTYQDKYARQGIRLGDLKNGTFTQKYEALKALHLEMLRYLAFDTQELATLEQTFFDALEVIKTLEITDTEIELNKHLLNGKQILAEGAQGTLLDINFGSYPFVTSSHTTASGACSGLGIPPSKVGKVYGIFKAYCTRVGSGPFPTELFDEDGERMRQEGREFGSTTGRPRRCGWLDLPALRYAIMINGATELLMMKADVLNIFDEIKVCTHYQLADGSKVDILAPADDAITPVYDTLPGWGHTTADITSFEQLPTNLAAYVKYIEQAVGVPITLVSVGPDRAQTIIRG